MGVKHRSKHIKLTSHPGMGGTRPIPIRWGAADPATRGPIVATLTDPDHRNAIGPYPSWHDPERIVSLDPYGALVADVFADYLRRGYDIRPTIVRAGIAPDELTRPKGRTLGE